MNRPRVSTLARGALAIGAIAALAGSVPLASATVSSGTRAIFVPITPCRLFDTRATGTVGSRSTPIGAGETFSLQVRGTNGNCTIPAGAVGVSMNTTAVHGTAASFLTLFPADATRPLASSLNWVAGQGATPNQLNVTLAADGRISMYNLTGTVDVLGDIVGYYEDHNHDDRTTLRSLAFPAQSLNTSVSAIITRNQEALLWQYNFAAAASISIHRPVDFVSTGNVTLSIFFAPSTSAPAGQTVQFFARPSDYNPGDPFDEASGIPSGLVAVGGTNFAEATIVIPGSSLPKEWWEISIQRDMAPATFTGDVRVVSVELSYTGLVVAPGS